MHCTRLGCRNAPHNSEQYRISFAFIPTHIQESNKTATHEPTNWNRILRQLVVIISMHRVYTFRWRNLHAVSKIYLEGKIINIYFAILTSEIGILIVNPNRQSRLHPQYMLTGCEKVTIKLISSAIRTSRRPVT